MEIFIFIVKNQQHLKRYFFKDWLFSEWMCTIKTSDIKSFRFIGGFAKYDKHKPEKLKKKISDKTDGWLYKYISGSLLLPRITQDVIDELVPFKPQTPIKIFRGIEEVEIHYYTKLPPPYTKGQIIDIEFDRCKSWTTNPLIARRFIEDYPSTQPFVVVMVAKPKDMLVDVQMLPKMYYHTNQREIIMKPGRYKFKIVWAG